MPMFPLGTVLVPTAVLPLHIFEPRYRTLMAELTADGKGGEFGVVLISRGSEVGGGDQRVEVGTVARLVESVELPDGRWVVAVAGTRRFRVDSWLPDAPYPVGEVSVLDDGAEAPDGALVGQTARKVRRALALAAEAGEPGVSVTFELDDDPALASWQLVALLPVGPLDRQRLLETDDARLRLAITGDLADEVGELLARRMHGEG